MATAIRKIKRYGWIPDHPDPRDRIYNLEFKIAKADELPPALSLRDKMPPVYNQGELGSCTANGSGGAFEYQQSQQSEGQTTPSRLFIYYNERVVEGTAATDSGAQVRTAIKVLAAQGAPAESVWPYDISQFAVKPPAEAYEQGAKREAIQYHRVLNGGPGAPIRTAINDGNPVVFGFSVPSMFESPSWDAANEPLPLPSQGESFIGGHCVVITGYDFSRTRFPLDVFEVRNSWGDEWGDGGYFYMDAQWVTRPELSLSSDFWVIQEVS